MILDDRFWVLKAKVFVFVYVLGFLIFNTLPRLMNRIIILGKPVEVEFAL